MIYGIQKLKQYSKNYFLKLYYYIKECDFQNSVLNFAFWKLTFRMLKTKTYFGKLLYGIMIKVILAINSIYDSKKTK